MKLTEPSTGAAGPALLPVPATSPEPVPPAPADPAPADGDGDGDGEGEGDEDGEGEGAAARRTSGPLAEHRDWPTTMSPVPNRPPVSRTWMPFTRMLVVVPGVLTTTCSLNVTVPAFGSVRTVFGAGVADTAGTPLGNVKPTSDVVPDDPSPLERQLVLTALAVTSLSSRSGLLTVAELSTVRVWLTVVPPCVATANAPVVRSRPTLADGAPAVKGPPPADGSVTEGLGPNVTGALDLWVTSTRAP